MESRNMSQFRNSTVPARNLNETSSCKTYTFVGGSALDIILKITIMELSACMTAFTVCFLALCGSLRRRNHSAPIRYAIKGAYLLTVFLVPYTIGQMQSAKFRNQVFAIWAVFYGVVLGCTDTITVFSLDENEKILAYRLRVLVQTFWIGWLFITNAAEEAFSNFLPLLYVLFVLTYIRTGEQTKAMKLACKEGRGKISKNISDYMANDGDSEGSESEANDPAQCMRECIYLVCGEGFNSEIKAPHYRAELKTTEETITVGKVWECRGKLLSLQDEDGELKDIFLSYVLFKLLCRRFSEFPFAESSLKKTWNFVCKGLIHGNDVERAFRVIEVELAFLYDFFYTKYPVIFGRNSIILRIVEFIIVITGFWISWKKIISYFSTISNGEVLVGGIVIVAIVIVEIVQFVFFILSDWLKLHLLCKYVAEPKWQEGGIREVVVRFICRRKRFKPWERKLGQYSLLKSLQPASIFVMAYRHALTSFEDKERRGITQGRRIGLPVQVKKAVANSLSRFSDRRLTNGVTSLKKYVENGVIEPASEEEILQACSLQTHTHVILVWHIATCLCEFEYSKRRPKYVSDAFVTATSLPNYCAYLVGFAPELLPNNARTTAVIFYRVIVEAKKFFRSCSMSLTELHQQLQNENMNTITAKGVRLACLLSQIDPVDSKWEVLSDFWSELMLFVSPSDDCNAHAEYLARGGEFVTHLWVLLSHACILHRPSSEPQLQLQQTAMPGPATEAAEGASTFTDKVGL